MAARRNGLKVGHVHLRYVNPLPNDLGDVLKNYKRVIVPEMNLGQLSRLVRAEFLVDAQSFTKVYGVPFRGVEIADRAGVDTVWVAEAWGRDAFTILTLLAGYVGGVDPGGRRIIKKKK